MSVALAFAMARVESAGEPDTAEAFARAAIRVICEAGVLPSVGERVFDRCLRAVESGATARMALRHPRKADAIDRLWRERRVFFRGYRASADKLAYLGALPGLGPVTKWRLARRLHLPEAGLPRAA